MLKHAFLLGALLFVPTLARAEDVKRSTEAPPTVVVRLASLDVLFDRVKLLGGLVGQDDLGGTIQKALQTKLGPKGLYGIDSSKPLGLYARVGADISDISGVVMVPVTDAKQFREMLESLDCKISAEHAGVYTVKQDWLPIDLQYRIANGYAYVGLLGQNTLAPDALLTPDAVFGPKPSAAALSLTLRLNQIPEDLRGLLGATLKEAITKLPSGGSDGKGSAALPAVFRHEINRILDNVLTDGQELNVQLDIEPKTKQMVLDLVLDPKTGSKLARSIAKLGQEQRHFAFGSDGDETNDARLELTVEGGSVLRVHLTMSLHRFFQ
jgi:hypothetical protein